MNSNLVKILVAGMITFLIVSCASQKNASSSQEQPQRSGQTQGGRSGGQGQGGQGGQGGQRQSREKPDFAQLISDMDTDNDGKIAESEVKGRLKNDFSKVDSDSDGYITEEEFDNAPTPQGR